MLMPVLGASLPQWSEPSTVVHRKVGSEKSDPPPEVA